MRNVILVVTGILIALSSAVLAQDRPAPTDDLLIPLDTTGISDWSYLNPASVPLVGRFAVVFHNTTSDRTFIVKMPFVYKTAEFESAFARARFDRGGRTLADVVCGVLMPGYEPGRRACTIAPRESNESSETNKDRLENVEELRVFIEALNAAEAAPSADECDKSPLKPACLVERLYWNAACEMCSNRRSTIDDYRQELERKLEDAAKALVPKIIAASGDQPIITLPTPGTCPVVAAALDDKVLIEMSDEPGVPTCRGVLPPPSPQGALDRQLYKTEESKASAKFARDRFELAKRALIAAAADELTQTLTLKESPIVAIRNALEAKYNDPAVGVEAREDIEMAAKLLNSYSANSPVPYPWTERRARYTAGRRRSNRTNITTVGDYGVSIDDCTSADGVTKCTASATVPPNQDVRFSNATLRHSPTPLIAFKVSFFGRTTPPPNSTAYVTLEEKHKTIASQFGIGLGIDAATAYDLPKDLGGHNRHTSGAGTAALEFTGGVVDGSVSLIFKSGDFGGPPSTKTVNVDEYQAKVFGPNFFTLQYGQFQFARPSSGIAVSETGEGLLLAYKKLAASYIIHRESDEADESISTQNDDYYVTILQMKNINPRLPGVDAVDLIAVYGNNKNDDRPKVGNDGMVPLRKTAYNFLTFGSEVRTSFDKPQNGSISLAAYHSERHVRPRRPESEELVKGRGTVGLLTVGWQWSGSKTLFEESSKSRPSYGPTFTVARGSGDNADTADRDEGYLGENAGFAKDKIFLSNVSKVKPEIGKGLKNKWYTGVQWSDARGSLLGWIARAMKADESIVSATTNVALHAYRFAHELRGRHYGGAEMNLEFLLEAPSSVTWSLGGAYYHRSEAVKLVGLKKDLWQITGGVSIKLQGP